MCQRQVLNEPTSHSHACGGVSAEDGDWGWGQDTMWRGGGGGLHKEGTPELRPGCNKGISHLKLWGRGIPRPRKDCIKVHDRRLLGMSAEKKGQAMRNAFETMMLHEEVDFLLWLFLSLKDIPRPCESPKQKVPWSHEGAAADE